MHTHDLPCELELLPGYTHIYPADFPERVATWLMRIE
jgi:hypothetical protein